MYLFYVKYWPKDDIMWV